MTIELKAIAIGTLAILMFGVVSDAVIRNSHASSGRAGEEMVVGSYACTTDTSVCSDGSYVGRVPPYCQFAQCPAY